MPFFADAAAADLYATIFRAAACRRRLRVAPDVARRLHYIIDMPPPCFHCR